MKILKITTLVVIIALFFNCSSDENVATTPNVKPIDNLDNFSSKISSDIYTDDIFVDYIKAAYDDSNLVIDIAELDKYLADDELSSAELADIHTVLGYNSYSDLTDHTTSQASRADYLNRNYGIKALTEAEQLEVFEKGFIMNIPEYAKVAYGRGNCRLKAQAMAVVMHVGCAAADVTVVVGILCHGAVHTWMYTELVDCNRL